MNDIAYAIRVQEIKNPFAKNKAYEIFLHD